MNFKTQMVNYDPVLTILSNYCSNVKIIPVAINFDIITLGGVLAINQAQLITMQCYGLEVLTGI